MFNYIGQGTPMYINTTRLTLDNEWSEEELESNIDDECIKLAPIYEAKYRNRAVYDKDLYKPPYLAEKIKDESGDLIEIYNKEYDKHRNEKMFGIHWFDKWIEAQVRRILNGNLVGGTK